MTVLPHWNDMAVVGRVARVHGLRGQVLVDPETDFPESRFQPGRLVYRAAPNGEAEGLRVASLRLYRRRPIVGFEGIESIEQAGPLLGLELRVPVASLEALPADVFYLHDLAGCRVETRSGQVVGTVERVEREGGASRLAVASAEGEVLVPLAADICVTVDVDRKVIVIEPPEGLLELNRSHRAEARRFRGGHRRSHKANRRSLKGSARKPRR